MNRISRALALAGCLLGGCTRMPLPSANADLAPTVDLARPHHPDPPVADLAATCPAPASANATIDGKLPDGSFMGRFAWVGYRAGDCGMLPILEVTESAAPSSPGAPRVTVDWQSAPVLGDQPVRVLVVDASGTLDVSGRVALKGIEPAGSGAAFRLAGTLTVNELGGKLSLVGDFAAPYCALVDSACM